MSNSSDIDRLYRMIGERSHELTMVLAEKGDKGRWLLEAMLQGLAPMPEVASFAMRGHPREHLVAACAIPDFNGVKGVIVNHMREGWASSEEETPFWTTYTALIDTGEDSVLIERIDSRNIKDDIVEFEFAMPAFIDGALVYASRVVNASEGSAQCAIECKWRNRSDGKLCHYSYQVDGWIPFGATNDKFLCSLGTEDFRRQEEIHGKLRAARGYIKLLAEKDHHIKWRGISQSEDENFTVEEVFLFEESRIVARTDKATNVFTVHWIRLPKF